MSGFSEMRRDINGFLSSLRQSIDRPRLVGKFKTEQERELLLKALLVVEEARIRFITYTRFREEPTASDWNAARREFLSFLENFISAKNIDPEIMQQRFRVSPMYSRDNENLSPFLQAMREGSDNSTSILEAAISFRNFIDNRVLIGLPDSQLQFGDLERIVPVQQIAPVQFGIVQDRIVIVKRDPRTEVVDRQNIQSALEYIRGSGEQLIANLEISNCDKRLLESVKELHSQLAGNSNIIKIGLTNMACGTMGAQFKLELPDAITAMLNGYNSSISYYVGQFPEWEQFTQKAAAIEFDDEDIIDVDTAVGEVVASLQGDPKLADPEVPKTILFVRQFLTFPGISSKRAAFAMIKTIENLVSSIIRHSVEFFSKTAEKTVDIGSTAASKTIIGLLGIALLGANGVGSAAVRAGAPWVQQAADVVQKQIEKALH